MRRAYVYKPANITAPIVTFQVRPASVVLPWTDQQKAAWAVARDRNGLVAAEANYAAACSALGRANRYHNKIIRRINVAAAFRMINKARASIRAARKALAASEIAAMQLGLPFAA